MCFNILLHSLIKRENGHDKCRGGLIKAAESHSSGMAVPKDIRHHLHEELETNDNLFSRRDH